MTTRSRSGRSTTLADPLRWQVAAFSAGAAAIHFLVIPEHVQEWWLFGAFFLVVAWSQAVTTVAVVARPDRRVLIAVLIVDAVVIAIWLWSRTAGLPIGPEAGEPEAVGLPDVLSTVLEALIIVWIVALLQPRIASRAVPRTASIATTVLVWAGVIGATALVFFTETREAMPH